MKDLFNHESLTEKLDKAIMQDACPILESMITHKREENRAKRNGYISSFGNNGLVKSYAYLDAKSGNLLRSDLENMDFIDLLRYLFYILDGRRSNPKNNFAKYDPAKSL